jgi:hypothetical protein
MPPISTILSFLTDNAVICVDEIHHDKENGIVTIYLQRNEITGYKKMLLGEIRPVYSRTKIKSVLTIMQVEEIIINVDDRLVDDCNSCFTVLFGLKVDHNRLYLGSAEEAQGQLLCQIIIKVKEMNIEFADDMTRVDSE